MIGVPEQVPVGVPIANMAVFIIKGEGQEVGSRDEHGACNCIKASDLLEWGTLGEVCVMGAGICAGYLRCWISASSA